MHSRTATLLVVALVAALALMMATPSLAFHNGSQLICSKCHTMHYSEAGAAPDVANGALNTGEGGPNESLLYKKNITDLCLSCHKDNAYTGAPSVYNTTPNDNLPGGDFGYCAKKDAGANAATNRVGKGHNPYGAPDDLSANIDKDDLNGGANGIAPPGNWTIPVGDPNVGTPEDLTAGEFVCTSCHGVHGPESGNTPAPGTPAQSYQSYGYRLLKAVVNGVDTNTTADAITSQAWILSGGSVVAGPDGADLTQPVSATNHNTYKGGFSAWCGACHKNFHGEDETVANGTTRNADGFVRHATNTKLGGTAGYGRGKNYGTTPRYDMPLVQVGASFDNINDKVMCLSCHKAHGTAYRDAVRWDCTAPVGATGGCNTCHKFGGGV